MDPSLFQTGPFLGAFSDYIDLARDYSQKKPIYTYYILLYVYNSRNSIAPSPQKDSYMNILCNYLNSQSSLNTADNLKRFYNICMRMKKDMNERYDLEGPSPDLCSILKSLAIQLTVIQAFCPDKNLSGEISKLNQRANAISQPSQPLQPPPPQQQQQQQQQPQFGMPNTMTPPLQPPPNYLSSPPPQQQPQFASSINNQQQPQFTIPISNTLNPPPLQQHPQYVIPNSQPPPQPQFAAPNTLTPPPQQHQPIYNLPVNNAPITITVPLPATIKTKGNGNIPQIYDISNPSCCVTIPHSLPDNDGSKPLSYDLLQYIDCFNSDIRSIIDAHLRAAIYFDISKDQHIDEYKKYVNCSLLSYKFLVDILASHINYDNRNNIKTLISSIYYPSLKRISILESYK